MPNDYRLVSQDELRAFYRLEQAFMDARNQYLAAQAKLVLRLNAGAHQEPGKYHIEKRVRMIRRISWKEIVIELRNQRYAEDRLNAIKPKAYTRLEFSDIGSNR